MLILSRMEIIIMARWTGADIPDQNGRLAVVTGANSGLGYQIALALAARSARVVLACRNQEKAAAAASALTAAVPSAQVEVRSLDLADLGSVHAFADGMAGERIDLLVNNAGLMAVDKSRTADGFEMQFGVNHLGHFTLTARLLPLLTSTPGSRIVTMSSMGHRAGSMHFDDLMFEAQYDRWGAYFQSKLANLLFTAELHRRLTASGATTAALAAHPGGSNTDLGFEGTSWTNRGARLLVPLVAMPAAKGALGALRAATDPAARSGEFYGPRFIAVGYPVRETPSRAARDAAAARLLWDRSLELTEVDLPASIA